MMSGFPNREDIETTLHAPIASELFALANARRTYERRRFRRDFIGSQELFREPAWDMLIYLFIGSCEGRRIPVTEVVEEAYIPQSSALREVHKLCDAGLAVRLPDPSDGRRHFVEIADVTRERLETYFGADS